MMTEIDSSPQEPPTHFLDATAQEEAASPLKLLLIFSFQDAQHAVLQGMRMLGPGELTPSRLKELVKACSSLLIALSTHPT